MDAAGQPSPIPSNADHEARQRQVEQFLDDAVARLKAIGRDVAELLRFFVFTAYLLGAILSFWLWVLSELILLVRVLVYGLLQFVLWVSGGIPRRPGESMAAAVNRDLRGRWANREETYRQVARPLAARYANASRAGTTFWYWSIPRKAMSGLLVLMFVVVPGLYIVPRPNYVQMIDDNSIQYEDSGTTQYLINAVDLFDTGLTREYVNETAWWLGKVNPQGLKNRLHPGRFYKLWVIGIRWYWMPRLFPNIIWASETDAQGAILANPSHFIPPTTTGS
jgi:hypothetical protein